MKKILITGGAGFIGSHLTEKLLERGDIVIVVDNFNRFYSPKRKSENLIRSKRSKKFFLQKADIRDKAALKSIFSKYSIDVVVHLAAMAGVRPSIENPKLYADVNVLGTVNVLEQIKDFGIKQLVFASSSSVYGNRSKGPFKESDETDEQISPYGATKKSGELLCHVYAHLYGIKTTSLRFFTVYGSRNRPDMACFKFVDAMMRNRPIMKFGKGVTGRDYTYIDDIVDGIVCTIDKPFDFEIINLGNSLPVKLNKLISTIEKAVGKKAKIKELPIQPGDVELTFANIDKANKLLDWKPKTKLKNGINNLIEWYKDIYA